jgi:acetyl/propionyl-CoA carboxylase alpha subunit
VHHAFKIGDEELNVALSRTKGAYRLHTDEGTTEIAMELGLDGETTLVFDRERFRFSASVDGDTVHVHLDGRTYSLRYRHPLDRLAAQLHGATDRQVQAPMPGSLVAIHVKPGDAVKRGQALLVMESMKMETTLVAPRDGVVEAVHFSPAQSFDRDAVLVTFEEEKP